MNKLKVGDRVAVYHGGRSIGTIDNINYGIICVQTGTTCGSFLWVHPKQCRKLKPKNKKVKKWRMEYSNDGISWITFRSYDSQPNFIATDGMYKHFRVMEIEVLE